MSDHAGGSRPAGFLDRITSPYWVFVLLLCAIAGFGVAMLYSVSGGRFDPLASRQMYRFGFGLGLLAVVALIDIRIWLKLAYPFYAVSLFLLALVPLIGNKAGGAQRWIDLGLFQLQPSEFMKIALVVGLAAYYQSLPHDDKSRPTRLIVPVLMILVPTLLVIKQPDLGTSILLLAGGVGIMYAAGVHWGYFAAGVACLLGSIPVVWSFLYDYQRQRILTFLNPESDLLGSGYHIMQSKIAVGSGGIWGKGLAQGTQSQLNFLPERHTDFIFTMLAEELGLVGGLGLLGAYLTILAFGIFVALRCANHFGRLLAVGVCFTLFLYVFVNVAMVTGLLPVVGVPLPLVSYGGTAMLTLMFGFGLLMNVAIHRKVAFTHHDTAFI